MITNEKQYKRTKAAIHDFQAALSANLAANDLDLLIRETNSDALQSELEILRDQVQKYEEVKNGLVSCLRIEFPELSDALILARIAANLTQKQLAELVGIKEQQIQRYEAHEYEEASFARLKEILYAMNCQIRLFVQLPNDKKATVSNDISIATSTSGRTLIEPTGAPVTYGKSSITSTVSQGVLKPFGGRTGLLAAKAE